MKIVVVVPSAEYTANAGVRIRYGRLIEGFAARGMDFAIEPIAGFDAARAECDVVIFSKCHDVRSIICAHALTGRGIRVGVDIFDDYFSQEADSRLIRFRSWLSQMLERCAFALASTSVTADLVRAHSAALPVHILNDPAPPFDVGQLADRLTFKRSEATSTGRLRVAWFGMGDNPHFALGLRDVVAFADTLSILSSGPFAVELTILTNRRSLDASGLEGIRSLPVPVTVEIWSEEREAVLLEEAAVAFLPVNANRFSRAKSLNRAVTALAAGCQVLSAGFPLYEPLGPLVYRDALAMLAHLRDGVLRLSPTTISLMEDTFAGLASVTEEVDRLLRFLTRVESPLAQAQPALFLVHGANSTIGAHSLAQSLGGLSLASPFCSAPYDFDAIVEMRATGDFALFVARHALPYLSPGIRKSASRSVRIKGRKYWEIAPLATGGHGEAALHDAPLPLQLGLYPRVIDGVRELLERNFAARIIVTSELSPLPFEQSGCVRG